MCIRDRRNEIKRFALEHGYSFHNIREHAGLMRNLIVRTASTGEVMAIVVFGEEDTPRIEALMSYVAERFPQITSLFYVINTKWNDSLADLTPVLYRGKDHILEQMEGLRFKVGPKSFYQTNSAQAYELYKVARDFAAVSYTHLDPRTDDADQRTARPALRADRPDALHHHRVRRHFGLSRHAVAADGPLRA